MTTIFGINLDAIFMFGDVTDNSRWVPYVGGGPNFSIRNRGFTESAEDTEEDGDPVEGEDGEPVDEPSRFDFSDTDFTAGFNFIAGARRANGMFFEMKATAYGISNIRLLVGFNFEQLGQVTPTCSTPRTLRRRDAGVDSLSGNPDSGHLAAGGRPSAVTHAFRDENVTRRDRHASCSPRLSVVRS